MVASLNWFASSIRQLLTLVPKIIVFAHALRAQFYESMSPSNLPTNWEFMQQDSTNEWPSMTLGSFEEVDQKLLLETLWSIIQTNSSILLCCILIYTTLENVEKKWLVITENESEPKE